MKKNQLKFLKKPTGSVQFYKPKIKKIEPNLNRKKNRKKNRAKPSHNRKNRAKLEKTEPNWFELVFILKNQTETSRFGFGFFLKKNNFNLVIFVGKNRTESKIITPTRRVGIANQALACNKKNPLI